MSEKQAKGIRLLMSDPVPVVPGIDLAHTWYQKTATTVASQGTIVDNVSLRRGYTNPTRTYTAAYNAIEMVNRAYGAEKKEYDGFIVGCAFDPGLRPARSLVNIPVTAPTESAALLACTLGSKFSIINYDPCFNWHMTELIRTYGLADRLASVRNIPGLTEEKAFEMMFGNEQDEFIGMVTKEMSKAIKEDGADVVWIACCVSSSLLTTRGISQVDGCPILDPPVAAVKMAETLVMLKRAYGTSICKKSMYFPPLPGWEKEIPIEFD